jgi:hypothetical protein
MPSFQRVSTGQPIKIEASTWNAVLAAAEAQSLGQGGGPAGRDGGFVGRLPVKLGAVDEGENWDRYQVAELDAAVFDPAVQEDEYLGGYGTMGVPVLGGKVPTAEAAAGTATGRWGVILRPGDEGTIVPAVVSGPVAVRINVTDEGHGWAVPIADDRTKLASSGGAAAGAARVLWKEAGTGEKWGVVNIGGGGGGDASTAIRLVLITDAIAVGFYTCRYISSGRTILDPEVDLDLSALGVFPAVNVGYFLNTAELLTDGNTALDPLAADVVYPALNVSTHRVVPTLKLEHDEVNVPGVAITSDDGGFVLAGMTSGTVSTKGVGYITVKSNPAPGKNLVVDDDTTTKTFIFTSGTPTGDQIKIGADVVETAANILKAINDSVLAITATDVTRPLFVSFLRQSEICSSPTGTVSVLTLMGGY